MSVYNSRPFLEEAIRSILDQEFKDFEFIVVDDASIDESLELVQKLARLDDRIRILRNETRLGLTKSLNRAISQATNEWIARQDADDLSHPGRFLMQMERLQREPTVGLIGTAYEAITEQKKHLYYMNLPVTDTGIKKWLPMINCFCHGSVIFSKKVFLRAGGYPEQYLFAQDYALWLRFAPLTKMENVPEALYKKRLHAQSVSVKYTERWQVLQQLKFDAGLIKEQKPVREFVASEHFQHGRFLMEMGYYKKGVMSFLNGLFFKGLF